MKIRKILSSISIILALSAFGTFSFPDNSDAKRVGGSRSIGRTVAPKATPSTNSGFTQQQQQRQNVNQSQAAGASTMSRGGMFGGLFGGLLAGTLLGSLLMGGGFAGAGMLDFLLIGLVAFLAFRFFKSRQANNQNNQSNQANWNRSEYREPEQQNNAWDRFRSNDSSQGYSNTNQNFGSNQSSGSNQSLDVNYPNFDVSEFISGAKTLYLRMQSSWDDRDLTDIKQFTTPELFSEIEAQFHEDSTPSKTEIILVEANLMEKSEADGKEYVSVLFDVLMREDQSVDTTSQVKEIWNFTKDLNSSEMWKLDGIQQV